MRIDTKPYYGYPIRLFLMNIPLSLPICLMIILLIIIKSSIIYIIVFILLFIISFIYGILLGKRYKNVKKITTNNLLNFSKIRGNEKILDLGTGAGIVAINIAKKLDNGEVYGIDRWNSLPIIRSRLLFHMITGSDLHNAEKNAKLENVSNKIKFRMGSLTEQLQFPDNFFDIICSNESLYFISNKEQRIYLLKQIDRVLKKDGRFIFCEPEKIFLGWNIQTVIDFFKQLQYDVDIFPVTLPRGWTHLSILVGKKN